MVVEACWPCVASLHEECFDLSPVDGEDTFNCCCFGTAEDTDSGAWAKEIGRPVSQPSDVADVLSTGRKRAAMLYPIYDNMACEWAGLAKAGGGVVPIVGCRGNRLSASKGGDGELVQGDVHHGPDKNTLANEPGNVHRICVFCHHRFHAANDQFYGKRPTKEDGKVDGTVPFLPLPEYELESHDSITLATEEEIIANELYWSSRK